MSYRSSLVGLGAAVVAVLGFVVGACYEHSRTSPAPLERKAIAELRLEPHEENLVRVFERVSPSVVNIQNNTFIRRWFSADVEKIPQGSGSGFVWDTKGHIVTNFHVVAGARSITVTLNDQSAYDVRNVVGAYPDKDIAVLHIEAPEEKLRPLARGSSADLRVGMTALAIGNPFGLDQTLTVGVVSALGRELQAPSQNRIISDVIQTDAAVNRGNSGGPLLNSRGELIGITTAILSPSGTNSGIAFAVPVDAARRVIEQFVEHGKYVRPILGISSYGDHLTRRRGVEGVWVRQVSGTAERAGLRGTSVDPNGRVSYPGDVIVAIDGRAVRNTDDLMNQLEKQQVGDVVEVTVLRGDTERRIQVPLQKFEIDG